jgi:hypothetical protein
MTPALRSAARPRPGPVETLASLAALEAAPASAVLLAGQPTGQSPEITQLRPTAAASASLSEVCQRAIRSFVDTEVIEYQPAGSAGEGQVMAMNLDAVPLLQLVLADSNDLANLPLFEPRPDAIRNLRLAAIRSETPTVVAVFVQWLPPNQVLARSSKRGFIMRRGTLEVPDGEILMLTNDITAIITGQYVFFRNRSLFQQLTGLLEDLRAQASVTLKTITDKLRIDGIEEMAVAVTRGTTMLAKMASIQRKLDTYPKYRQALTMPNLVKFVLAHPECGIEMSGTGRKARLVFRNDPQSRWKILKLLDDDYLRSELTSFEYESNSKSSPLG